MEASNKETPPMREMKIYYETYHNQEIRIVELEHTPKIEYGTFTRLDDWREKLDEQLNLNQNWLFFPEYCIPEIETTTFNGMGGELARGSLDKLGITDFYSHIAMVAGKLGKSLFASDVATDKLYHLYEKVSGLVRPNTLSFSPDNIEDTELTTNIPADARHLFIARGIMQEVLRKKNPIIHINAPVHSVRIDNYIGRQIKHEKDTGVQVKIASDFISNSPQEEQQKMRSYNRLPFPKAVREYIPILSSLAYEIDLMLSNPNQRQEYEIVSQKIDQYLSSEPKNENEKEIHIRMKKVKEAITNLGNNLDTSQYEKATKSIMTSRFGWKLASKVKIF